MIRFETVDGKEYKRRPFNFIVFILLAGAVLLHDFSLKIAWLRSFSTIIRISCIVGIILCVYYIIIKLLERKINRPEYGEPGYMEEFVELYEDHIRICEFASVLIRKNGQKYDFAEIFYDDINYTSVYGNRMKIVLVNNPSPRTRIAKAEYNRDEYFSISINRYPQELKDLLFDNYRNKMKTVKNG